MEHAVERRGEVDLPSLLCGFTGETEAGIVKTSKPLVYQSCWVLWRRSDNAVIVFVEV
ncbi:hypothetical protein [Edaphobacter dinghuensis]|uniref:Uncharacterized protein n=1 Tax=Edaphobacter dinghuensis TaxID=1560005 RepID=A0A917M9Q3_9BACT|nr:hypothetical protein [Edaphobacter dinghuensis]GGG86528.1 hypothetical protein GCM10011585_33090 [Edaphobacter dinghuensis]